MVMCDWSARDLQQHEMLGSLGPTKGKDTATSFSTVGADCILELSTVHGTQAYPWLQPGDTVHLEVEQLGVIESAIAPGPPAVPLH